MIVIRRQPTYYPYSTLWLNQPNAAFCNGSNNDETKPTTGTIDKKSEGNVSPKKAQNDSPTIFQGRNFQVTEDDNNFSISIDLPGVKANNVDVAVEDGSVLRVYAERKSGDTITSKFDQRFAIDEETVDSSNFHAALSDGVLTIDAPKKEAPKPMTVTVVAGDAPEEVEDSKDLHLLLDVPGVKLEALNVVFHKGTLMIQGERKKGRFTSQIRRSSSVDAKKVDVSKLEAFLADGVLTVTAPCKEALPSKSILIGSGPAAKAVQGPSKGQENAEPEATQDPKTEAEKPLEEEVSVETVEEEDEEEADE